MVSVNQVKHFFLMKKATNDASYKGFTDLSQGAENVSSVAKVGDIELVKTKTGDVFFRYMGNGGIITSDYIKPSQINYIVAKKAASSNKKLNEVILKLNSSLVLGEDYIVNILIHNYIAMGDESTLQKFAAVHCSNASDTDAFYKAVAESFVRNFARDVNKFFKFYLLAGTDRYLVTMDGIKAGKVTKNDGSKVAYPSNIDGVVIAEESQEGDYIKGEVPVTTVNFDVFPQTVLYNGEEVQPWANVEDTGAVTKNKKTAFNTDDKIVLTNAYEISDTEYFCAGERGDMLRGVNYPKNFRTKYLIDTPNPDGYATLDISYYSRVNGVPEMRSNKQILIVAENDSLLSGLIGNLEEALDMSTGSIIMD